MRLKLPLYITVLLWGVLNYNLFAQINVTPVGDRKIEPQQSLSQGRINALIEDNDGVMWVGTLDGLNSYDGYNIEVFRHDVKDSTSLSNSTINDLKKDSKGNIWIATEYGLNVIFPKTRKIKSYYEDINEKFNDRNVNQITSLFVDADDNIWYSTNGAGIVQFNPETNSRIYFNMLIDTSGSSCLNVRNFLIDREGYIWFACLTGSLYKMDIENNTIEKVSVEGISNDKTRKTFITSIFQRSDGTIYFTLAGEKFGLFYYNHIKNVVEMDQFTNRLNTEQFLGCLINLSDIIEDESGNLWISNHYVGFFKYSADKSISFYPDYILDKHDPEYFGGPGVKCMYLSESGVMWLGSNGYGLSSINDFNFFFTTFSQNQFSNSFTTKSVRSIIEDKRSIWVGGYKGLVEINKSTNLITAHLFGQSIYELFPHPLNENLLFIGTEGGGLFLFDKKHDTQITKFPEITYNSSLEGTNIYTITKFNDTLLWIGRNIGLEKYNLYTNEFEYVKIKNDINFKKENNLSVLCSLVDDNKHSWFGTIRNGIWVYNIEEDVLEKKIISVSDGVLPNRINSITQDTKGNYFLCTDVGLYVSPDFDSTFRKYSTKDGLPNDYIYACIEDELGNYWISSNKGITNWQITDTIFVTYTTVNGLQGDEFNTGAYYKSNDGIIYFGGINGLTHFNPKYLNNYNKDYQFVLVKILENNTLVNAKEVAPGNYSFTMDANSNNINIEIALLSYLGPEKNEYQYKVLNTNSDWQELGASNNIIIDKPNYGEQIIQIRARVNGKEWNKKQISVQIFKPPHFYQRWIFWVFIIFLIVIALVFFVKYRMRNIQKEKTKLEKIVTERTSELIRINNDLQQSNKTKDKLFSIIAHDLRNPLNSLLGFTSLLHTENSSFSKEEVQSFVEVIYNSSKNLNNLLDNLLGWSRLQMKKINPSFRNISLNEIIETNLIFMEGNIEEKSINIINNCEPNLEAYADFDMISLVVRNLISNAIKFTHKEGVIEINNSKSDNYVVLTFKDNGVGMDKETQEKILMHGKNITSVGTNNEVGTGLGLFLCIDFVKLNNGKLEIESEPHKGSNFMVYLLKSIY